MPDKNQFSITGDQAGNIWVNNEWIHPASAEGIREIRVPALVAKPGEADLLKISGVERAIVYAASLDARNAAEDAIDINHSHNVEVLCNDLWPGKTYAATVKGGSTGIKLVVGRQHGHGGSGIDYDYGNFSDQGNAKTTGCELNVATVDGAPVVVRLLTADAPKTFDATGQTYRIKSYNQGYFYPLFNLLKDLLRSIGIKI